MHIRHHRVLWAILWSLFLGVWHLTCAAAPSSTLNKLSNIEFTSLPNDQVRCRFSFTDPLTAKPRHFFTKSPAQLVIDFNQSANGLDQAQVMKEVFRGTVKEYQVAQVGNRLRVILKLDEVVSYTEDSRDKQFTVTLGGRSKPNLETLKSVKPRAELPAATAGNASFNHRIEDVSFRGGNNNLGRLTIRVSDTGTKVDVEKRGKYLDLKFLHMQAPSRFLKRYDVRDFSSPAQTVDLLQRKDNVLVRVSVEGSYKYFAYQVDKAFIVEFEPRGQDEEKVEIKDKVYTGKRLSLNFQSVSVRTVLQLIAEFTGINIVISDTVAGNITLKLEDVPWDQALDIIMETRALGKRNYGGVLIIGNEQELVAKEQGELEARQKIDLSTPLISELVQINYAKAEEIQKLLQSEGSSLLSVRGKVSVDARTNIIWLQDTPEKVNEVRDLIKKLDIPVKQVLIEARIVTIDKDFEKSLGVRFGLGKPKLNTNLVTGSRQPYGDPDIVPPARGVFGGPGPIDAETNLAVPSRYNVDLPAISSTANVGSIGVALAKLGRGIILDLELSALETEGKGKIIASPRIITSNQKTASIEAGEEIPYQEATSSGATNISFKEVVLRLEVTPQITPDNRIVVDLQINQDTQSQQILPGGVPVILTKKIKTSALVDNGETIVLGGIYQKVDNHSLSRIPFFGKLPLIGPLFRNNSNTDNVEELIIFVTPKIIQQSAVTG